MFSREINRHVDGQKLLGSGFLHSILAKPFTCCQSRDSLWSDLSFDTAAVYVLFCVCVCVFLHLSALYVLSVCVFFVV